MTLVILDMRADIAALPRQPGATPQGARALTRSITFHYSGVRNTDRSRAAERLRMLGEAREHLRRDWRTDKTKGRPIYGSHYQYQFVVWSDGTIVRVGDDTVYWHAGNKQANETSLPVHVMLGPGQDLTPAQNVALGRLFDHLCAEYGIAPWAIVGHCEWPRNNGPAQPNLSYAAARRAMPTQSECPGALLHAHVVAARTSLVQPQATRYRAPAACWVRAQASPQGRPVDTLLRGAEVFGWEEQGAPHTHPSLGVSDRWVRLATGGYVWAPQLEAMG